MPTDSTPPLLDPYIRIPSTDTLILSTYVLGALNNWVLIRYLHACLRDSNSKSNSNSNSNSNNRNGFHNSDVTNVPREQEKEKQAGDDVAVVLVSWMRDFAFWKTEAKRAVVCAFLLLILCIVGLWWSEDKDVMEHGDEEA